MILTEITDPIRAIFEKATKAGPIAFHETDVLAAKRIIVGGGIKSIKKAYPSSNVKKQVTDDMPPTSRLKQFGDMSPDWYAEYTKWIYTTTFNLYGNDAGYYQYFGNATPDVLFIIDLTKLPLNTNTEYEGDAEGFEAEYDDNEGGLLQVEDEIPLSAISFVLINNINGPENYKDSVAQNDNKKSDDARLKDKQYHNIVASLQQMCNKMRIPNRVVNSDVYEPYRRRLIKLFKRGYTPK